VRSAKHAIAALKHLAERVMEIKTQGKVEEIFQA
jgi:hypothetical protein